ncbi:MAG: DNA gyrase subunit A [Anaerolineae bacterium]|nr:DNA gyrase subunit A [Anaerolineae bacterium]
MTNGIVRQVNIGQEMREAYLDYAMSVIVARALPDARDGLKPVHRRILYAMYDMGIRSDSSYKKSARIVGEVLGKYHPHGDSAVYESMVRLAQDFSMRYELIDGQGNFGSIDGDGAAAMRYTEARMEQIGEELLVDIDKQTVDFVENFDGSLSEPTVLPSAFPNLLVNGSSGIAVGMSTNIPPHNLNEICDALTYMLTEWDKMEDINVNDLMKFVKGPDFPTGGLVYRHIDGLDTDEDTLVSAYATGRGKITMRAKIHMEDMGRGKSRIIVSELPYQTNKSSLIERIANLVRDGKLEGIADLRDESDRQGLRLVIELQRGAEPTPVLSNLFRLTPLQETFSINTLALVDNEPRTLSLKQCLKVYLDHRLDVIKRRSEFDLMRARERAHILEALLKALDAMDQVIATIRKSQTPDTARTNLMNLLKIDDVQAQAILDMQLRRLAALERKKIDDEYKEKIKLIKYLQGLLESPLQQRKLIAEELGVIKDAYGDRRRTVIMDSTATAIQASDLLVPSEDTWATMTVDGKMGRIIENAQPKVTADLKDPPRFIMATNTAQIIYLFTSDGQCATIPVHQLPEINEPAEGAVFSSLVPLASTTEITAALSLPETLEQGYLMFSTTNGEIKRLRIEDLPGMTTNAFTVMDVEKDDKLGWVMVTSGENEVILSTAQGQTIRFSENDVRPTGLSAGGMRGIKLQPDDRVIGAFVVILDQYVWSMTDDGVAQISPIANYPSQGRAGSGVIGMRLPSSSRELAATTIGRQDDNIVALTNRKKAFYMRLGRAPQVPRGKAGGDFIISMREKEQVIAVITYQQRVLMPEPVE